MSYPSDLKDTQWKAIEPLLPPKKENGRPASIDRKCMMNAVFYVVKTGCQWRYLPHDFPHWNTVYQYFRKLCDAGIWEKANKQLSMEIRENVGRDANPSLGSIDSQSVKADVNAEGKGFDGNKKIYGRKRHIVVDVLGLIIACVVTAANTADVVAGREILKSIDKSGQEPRLEKILGDSAYQGLDNYGGTIRTEISEKKGENKGFQPIRHRWKVERTFAWLYRQRRLTRDYEVKNVTHEQMIYVSMIRLGLNRLT